MLTRNVWHTSLLNTEARVAGTHIQVEESQDSFVRENVEGVACALVDDRQSVHFVDAEGLDGFEQALVRVHVHQALRIVVQHLCQKEKKKKSAKMATIGMPIFKLRHIN